MQVGNQVYLFKNINLLWKIPYSKMKEGSTDLMLKDPSKGIVHKKQVGSIVRILAEAETLIPMEIDFYCRNNIIMRKSFEQGSSRGGVRIIVEFPESTSGRYRMVHEFMWKNGTPESMLGYARIAPNSVSFIRDEI